ncbi:MAG: ABC transporter permease subunit [Candidatus Schekmanbacteria bacterium]|nr:ABC transporter permease subunit [Candidatus Schekmanbacteria bacterium]
MRAIWAVFKKELKTYFTSPIAYTLFVVFLFLGGYFFFSLTAAFNMQSMHYTQYNAPMNVLNMDEMIVKPLFYNLNIILLLMMPLLTMRIYAEEKKSGCMELLLTSPITSWQLVAGKFLSALFLYMLLLVITLAYPLILFLYGNPDLGKIAGAYLGMLLVGASYIAAGTMASSLTENQIVAAATSFGLLLTFWIIGWAGHFVEGNASHALNYISLVEHFAEFVEGVVDTKHLVYYFSFIGFNLFLTNQFLELK